MLSIVGVGVGAGTPVSLTVARRRAIMEWFLLVTGCLAMVGGSVALVAGTFDMYLWRDARRSGHITATHTHLRGQHIPGSE
jgi:hypothetical protein